MSTPPTDEHMVADILPLFHLGFYMWSFSRQDVDLSDLVFCCVSGVSMVGLHRMDWCRGLQIKNNMSKTKIDCILCLDLSMFKYVYVYIICIHVHVDMYITMCFVMCTYCHIPFHIEVSSIIKMYLLYTCTYLYIYTLCCVSVNYFMYLNY